MFINVIRNRFAHRPSWRLVLPVLLLAGIIPFAASCAQDSQGLSTIDEQLVAPPNVPPPITRNSPAHVVVDLTAVEKVNEIAPGVQYQTWTFNGTDPGPMIRVREGDTVEIRLTNPASNTQAHNIDLHAVNGPGGGMAASNALPGQTRAFTFKAKVPGLFVYHCAAGIVADHIANGMYGSILVEPAGGMPTPADREYYIGQNEFYTSGATNAKGLQALDYTKLAAEQPTYVTFNGNTKSLVAPNALQAKTGETVRLYVSDGGPNLISSFHVIGEIFDQVWEYGSLQNPPLQGLQTVLIPPGGSAIVQFKTDVPGDFKLVDHAISRVGQGAAGVLTVTGPDDPSTFNPLTGADMTMAGGNATMAPSATTAAPSATTAAASTTAAPSATTAAPSQASNAGSQTLTLSMRDNVFDPTSFTVKAGQKITFDLKNEGKIPHNLSIADASGSYGDSASDLVPGGQDITYEWTAPSKPGKYNFRCDVHPQQMTGTITVQ